MYWFIAMFNSSFYRWVCLLCCLAFGHVSAVKAAAPDDFAEAKRMASKVFSQVDTDFYCGCPIRWQAGKGIPQLKECGYSIRKNGPRAQRIEWEHVMPAQQFGSGSTCWQTGGRDLCSQKDSAFRQMEADLYNLRPVIGEVNGDRAHFRFAELADKPAQYGACPFQVDFQRQLAEPAQSVRGDIARIYFYMADRYQVTLSKREEKLFMRWHQQDPVDDAEQMLTQRIAQAMGWPNPFVSGEKIWFEGYQVNQSGPAISDVAFGSARQGDAQLADKTMLAAHSNEMTTRPRMDIAQKQVASSVAGNKNSRKYHLPHCPGYKQMKESNRQYFASEQAAIAAGYSKAGNCK